MLDIQVDGEEEDLTAAATCSREHAYMQYSEMWPYTLRVAGSIHILHNAGEHFCSQLEYWPTFISALRPLAAFLHNGAAVERFIERCVLDSDQAPYAHLLERSFQAVYTSRWGSVMKVLSDLLDVRVVLQRAWNKTAFLDGVPTRRGRGSGAGAGDLALDEDEIAKIDSAICSPVFWASVYTSWSLQLALDELTSWCEGLLSKIENMFRNIQLHYFQIPKI